MLRLILVDDEKIIRESISNLIDWGSHGIELIGTCKNGIEAYDMILDEYPDIVMTDIKMPGMDGLELIERVRNIDQNIQFVILSGYGEFEFAKKAMKYGVKHYLLKPCNEEQISSMLEDVTQDYYKTQQINQAQNEKTLLFSQYNVILKKQFIIDALTAAANIEHLLDRYSKLMEFAAGPYYLYYFLFLEEKNLSEFTEKVDRLKGSCHFSPYFNMLYVKNTALLILSGEQDANNKQLIDSLQKIEVKEQTVQMEVTKEEYPTLSALLSVLIPKVKRYNKILLIEEDGTHQKIYNYAAVFEQVEKTAQQLSGMDEKEKIDTALDTFFSAVNDIELAKTLAGRLAVKLESQQNETRSNDISAFMETLYHCKEVDEIKSFTKDKISEWLLRRNGQNLKRKDFISKTLQYMEENMSDPQMSLKWIAENYLYMNVDYLSKQFLKETGEKFSVHLNRIRMKKAQQLLLQYDGDKIYTVAEQVGCGHNPRYFSQIFKKFTGLTPTAYVEKAKNGTASV